MVLSEGDFSTTESRSALLLLSRYMIDILKM